MSHTIQWETLTDAWLFSDIGLIDFQVRVVPAVLLAWLKTVLSAIQGWNLHSHRNPQSQEISFQTMMTEELGCYTFIGRFRLFHVQSIVRGKALPQSWQKDGPKLSVSSPQAKTVSSDWAHRTPTLKHGRHIFNSILLTGLSGFLRPKRTVSCNPL